MIHPDPHRHPLYRAEDTTFPNEKLELDLSELQWIAEEIAGAGWFRQRYGWREWTVKDGRGAMGARAGRDGKSSHMPHGTRLKYLLVHEMAHCVDGTGAEDHGAIFAAVYLFMVGRVYSATAKKRLAQNFRERGVIWDKRIAETGKP